ncbi:MAG: RluA family pseudouridine synthase [Leptospiraceae bacterium]|nr:RluA family pseudouridine synthase [Leptospiraceae bacterium]
MELYFTVSDENTDLRLDHFLNFSTGDEISRTSLQKWIKEGHVILEGGTKSLKPNFRVSEGEKYKLTIPKRPKMTLDPVKMDISVIREEEDFLIINKPAGIASHGGPEDHRPSLVNGLLYYFKELSKVGGEARPGIVHRLDKPTSGLMVIAKNDKAHIALANLFMNREIEKQYYAWLIQTPRQNEGRIEGKIARHPTERLKMCISDKGRKAITNYKIEKTISSKKSRLFSLANVHIETGRTHQIRVHFQSLRCPVVGDMLYSRSGNEFQKYGLLLFSSKLKFKHPFKDEMIDIEIPFPDNFQRFESEAHLF